MRIQADTEIAGKLRLVKPLGEGSAGHVWLAKHLDLGSEVAVKFLQRDVAADATGRERFVREARTVARLRSPHIVQVHDFGFHEKRAYLVMEYLVGETLEARMRRVGAMPTIDVVRVCTQIAKALQKAHDAGIVHRDIKPANVFLVDYGDEEVAKVVDFGIVKAIDATNLGNSTLDVLTQEGSLLGTPNYMSPEQIEDAGGVAHQTDLWSLGVIVYECLVGKHPLAAPNFAQLVMAICHNPLPVPSRSIEVSREFDAWFARALHRDPAERFQSAREMARELCHALVFIGSDSSMLRGSVPPDLYWSGAFPSFAPVTAIVAVGSDRPSRPDSEPSDRPSRPDSDPSGPSENARTLVSPPSVQDIEVRDAAVPKKIEVLDNSLTSSGDGSLGSHVAPKARVEASGRKSLRTALVALGAVVLVSIGWIASRVSRVTPDAVPQESASVTAPGTSVPALPASTQSTSARSTASATASAPAASRAASSTTAPAKPPPTKVQKPKPVAPPVATPGVNEKPPKPSLDDLLRRRQ